jgi:hypothetical protein
MKNQALRRNTLSINVINYVIKTHCVCHSHTPIRIYALCTIMELVLHVNLLKKKMNARHSKTSEQKITLDQVSLSNHESLLVSVLI